MTLQHINEALLSGLTMYQKRKIYEVPGFRERKIIAVFADNNNNEVEIVTKDTVYVWNQSEGDFSVFKNFFKM